jgi:serine-type D-Ala-D-Ala carboxypeptidase/endopeptidase (penicillin-binding protein 4)
VAGDLILNDSFFDSVLRHPDWPRSGETKWYQAPISALSYNDNVVLVAIRPGARAGRPAAVALEPPTELLQAVSHARTVNRRGRVRVAVNRQLGSNAVMVFGTVPLRGVWWSTPIAVDNPPAFFGDVLKNRLQNAGIEVTGGVVEENVAPDSAWSLIAQTESDLVPALAVTNKKSQGFYAEQIFKTLAAERTGKGSWVAAVSVERSFLAELGLDPTHFDLHDGSGLSPENRVSAADVVAFLRAMNTQPNGPVWKSTLAVSGDPEGTLRHRLSDRLLAGRVVAKTGSISGVSTLAGYVTAASGRSYAFAILLNGRRVYDTSGHAFQDRLLRALVKNG